MIFPAVRQAIIGKSALARRNAGQAMNLRARLISVREQRGWSVQDAADQMGVSPQYVQRLESVDYNPTLSEVAQYALILDAEIVYTVKKDRGDQ